LPLEAILFDVDGTLVESEDAHLAAFNQAFAEAGLAWHWSEDDYRRLLTTSGGRERIARYMREQGIAGDSDRMAALHVRKNAIYAQFVADGAVAPRPGVVRLIGQARRRGVKLGIATTTSRVNLTALLDTVFAGRAADWFSTIVAGEDVARKKPDPEVYRLALAALAVDPAHCLAIEDSRAGLDAALAAGVATLITPSKYTSGGRFQGAALIVPDLAAPMDLGCLEALLSG